MSGELSVVSGESGIRTVSGEWKNVSTRLQIRVIEFVLIFNHKPSPHVFTAFTHQTRCLFSIPFIGLRMLPDDKRISC